MSMRGKLSQQRVVGTIPESNNSISTTRYQVGPSRHWSFLSGFKQPRSNIRRSALSGIYIQIDPISSFRRVIFSIY